MACLIQIDGYDPVAAAVVPLNLASDDDDRICLLNGQTWWPVAAKLPALRYDLFGGQFDGRVDTPGSSLSLATEPWPNLARYALADARCRIWQAAAGTDWAGWTLIFDGRVTAQPAVAAGIATLSIAVDDRWLDAPLLAVYAGTGGAEGHAGLKGTAKPLALGAPRYEAGVLIDLTNTVVQLSAAGAVNGVEAALERLVRFGAAVGDYASYSALVAASIPPGAWATAKAAGMVRHGAPPFGKLSYLVQGDSAGTGGWVQKPGALIRRICEIAGQSARVDTGSTTALDSSRPYNLSLVVNEQSTLREVVQRIAASVNAVAGVSWTGKLFVAPVGIAATAALTLQADGSALPPVASLATAETGVPAWRTGIEAVRAWAPHELDEIAFTATLSSVGAYLSTTVYREGNIVQQGGASWLYTNPTPTAGNAPPTTGTSNTWWTVFAAGGSSTVIQGSVTGTGSWHSPPVTGDLYIRVSNDGGATFGDALPLSTSTAAYAPRGTWAGSTAYAVLDLVAYGGSSYVAIDAHTSVSGSPPPNSHWQLLAAAGANGATGATGATGAAGAAGAPGATGAAGATLYTWIAYADAADGSINFTTGAPGDRKFIGIAANQATETEGTTASAYTWSAYAGPAAFGLVNAAGCAVAGNKIIRTAATVPAWDASVYSSEAWTGGAQISWRAGQTTAQMMIGLNTDPTTNNSFDSIDYAWFVNGSGSAQPYVNGSSVGSTYSYTTASAFQVHYDGKAVRYYQDGALRFTQTTGVSAGLKFYLDTSFVEQGATATIIDFSAAGSAGTDGSAGATGSTGATGAAGAPGATGPAGYSTATIYIFKRATSTPALPTATTTYTFATGALTGLDNGWSLTPPSGIDQLYIAVATALATAATDTIAASEWSSPVAAGSNGAAGLNVATVYIYQRATSTPTLPSVTATYTFATQATTGLNNGWTTTIPSGSNPIFVSTATAATTGTTDTIGSGEWAAAQILAQNGATGATGASAFTLINATGCTVTANSITKTGADGWDAGPYSLEAYVNGAFVSFKAGQTTAQLMVALNTDPATDNSYTSLDFAIFCGSSGTAEAWENNSGTGVTTSYTTSDVLSIHYDGATVRYLKNGVVFRSRTASAGQRLYFDSSFNNSGGAVTNITFSPAGAKGDDGGTAFPPMKITGVGTFAYPYPISLEPGGSFTGTGSLRGDISGSSATVMMQIQASASGAGSWSVIASDSQTGLAGEPVTLSPAGSGQTNATGAPKLYDVQIVVTKSGGTVAYSNGYAGVE